MTEFTHEEIEDARAEAHIEAQEEYEDQIEDRSAPEFLADVPGSVRIALTVLLNHIEPGYENCKALVSWWLSEIERKGPE